MSGCPYKPAKTKDDPKTSPGNGTDSETPNDAQSKCPVMHNQNGQHKKVYNVYSQEVNPDNQMPQNPNQLPREDQPVPLSTARVVSTIPKGNTEETWTYPSPQMFYNALKRKGKGEDVVESDMSSVVAVHNSMNEQTWNQILKWERFRPTEHEASAPSLFRFMGRPHDISPKAWFLSTFTDKPKPFDRHDWTVLRGDEEVRYVIDYYYMDGGQGGNTTLPVTATGAFDKGALDDRMIYVDARPALDSWSGIVARAKAFFGLETVTDPFVDAKNAEPSDPQRLSHSLDVDQSSLEERFRPEATEKMSEWLQTRCGQVQQQMLEMCGNDPESSECNLAAMSLRVCTADVICPEAAEAFKTALAAKGDGEEAGKAWQAMDQCLEDYANKLAKYTQTDA